MVRVAEIASRYERQHAGVSTRAPWVVTLLPERSGSPGPYLPADARAPVTRGSAGCCAKKPAGDRLRIFGQSSRVAFLGIACRVPACYGPGEEMRTVTKKHSSVENGKARFAQVTVAVLTAEEEAKRPSVPELFLNDFRVNRLTKKDEALIYAAVRAVQIAEQTLGWRGSPLCVTRVESSFVDRDPDAAQIAATKAATALINE